MGRAVLHRAVAAVILFLVISFLVFSLLALAPGSLETTLLGARPATPELIAAIRAEYHLDDPFLVQYLRWLGGAVQLDFGRSIVSGAPVLAIVSERLLVSVQLAVLALVFAAVLAIPAGMMAAAAKGRARDRMATFTSVLAMSAPPFVVGTLLIYLFGVYWSVLPVYGAGTEGFDRFRHLILPAVSLGLGLGAIIFRQTRAAALDVLDQDFITFARARGLSRTRVAVTYALRNVALPIVASLGLVLIVALPGAVLIEVVFSIPGFGSMMVEAVGAKDVPVVQGLALFSAVYVVAVTILVDMASAAVDPRLRRAEAR
ncbi:MAG: ABC transporter permease [Cryobacterium sp.]|nr:ABC transporter permease [Cryobacterium sp.]